MAKLLKRIKTQNVGALEEEKLEKTEDNGLKLMTKLSSYSNLEISRTDSRRKSLTPDVGRFSIFSQIPIFSDFMKELNSNNFPNFHEYKDFYDVTSYRGSPSHQNDRVPFLSLISSVHRSRNTPRQVYCSLRRPRKQSDSRNTSIHSPQIHF